MAGNAQSGVVEQESKHGPPLPSQLYVPAAAVQGFAAPAGDDEAVDGTPTGYASARVNLARVPSPWHQSNLFASTGTGGSISQAAGGANTILLCYGFIATVFGAAAIWTAKIVCTTWQGPQTIYVGPPAGAGATTTFMLIPTHPLEASAVNGGITWTLTNNAGGNLAASVNLEAWGGIRQV